MRVISTQPILVYPEKSREIAEIVRRGGKHPLIELEVKYPGEWVKNIQILPFLMKVRIEWEKDLEFGKRHLSLLRGVIRQMVNALPKKYRSSYSNLIEAVERIEEKPESEINGAMDVPRAIEYLTIASCRYLIDNNSSGSSKDRRIVLQGLTLPSRRIRNQKITFVWLFHNYNGPEIDALIMECLGLAREQISAFLGLQGEMNLSKILTHKIRKFRPPRSKSYRRKCRQRLRHQVGKALSSWFSSFLFNSS